MNMGVTGEHKLTQSMGLGLRLSYIIGSFDMNNNSYYDFIKTKMSASSFNITGFISFRSK